ncbi:uncharacterized protein METZ01_LOCUS328415, partial [marine metagenome]
MNFPKKVILPIWLIIILLGGPISFLFAQDIVPPGFHFQFDLGDLPELKTDSPGEETL